MPKTMNRSPFVTFFSLVGIFGIGALKNVGYFVPQEKSAETNPVYVSPTGCPTRKTGLYRWSL